MVVNRHKAPLRIGRDQSVGPVDISINSINNQLVGGHQRARRQGPSQVQKDILHTILLHYDNVIGAIEAERSV
jgi:hypothetical protein